MHSDTNRKSDEDSWCAVADSEVETHRSVVDIAHFCEHSVKVDAVDSRPSEGR
jgi:hypothetical protein